MLPISKMLLKCVNGGSGEKDEPKDPSTNSPVKIFGGGNADHAAGTVVVTIPINEKTSAKVFVEANTATGVTAGGFGAVYKFW